MSVTRSTSDNIILTRSGFYRVSLAKAWFGPFKQLQNLNKRKTTEIRDTKKLTCSGSVDGDDALGLGRILSVVEGPRPHCHLHRRHALGLCKLGLLPWILWYLWLIIMCVCYVSEHTMGVNLRYISKSFVNNLPGDHIYHILNNSELILNSTFLHIILIKTLILDYGFQITNK